MKWILWIVGGVLLLGVAAMALQIIASESAEVVVLHTRAVAASAAPGETASTRLWVVDHHGLQWLRSGGGPDAGWYGRVLAHPDVELERAGQRRRYRALPEPAMTDQVNALMASKYGWRDMLIGAMLGGRDDAVAIRLQPSE